MEHEPRLSIDGLTGTSLAIGPVKEWYLAFDWIYDHGTGRSSRSNTLYSGLGVDLNTYTPFKLSANFYARRQFQNYGAGNEYSWDGYRAQVKYFYPVTSFEGGASLNYIGFVNHDFGSDLPDTDGSARTSSATAATNILMLSWTHMRYWVAARYFHNGGNWNAGEKVDFGAGPFTLDNTGWAWYLGIGYQF